MLNKNILRIISDIPENVKLVAISKTKPAEDIMMAYETGQRLFGENKIQEMSAKFEDLPKDIKWHMVGHVQSNKIKYMAPYVDLIHGIDSLKSIKILNYRSFQLLYFFLTAFLFLLGLYALSVPVRLALCGFCQLYFFKL